MQQKKDDDDIRMKEKFCFKYVKTYYFPNREVLKANLSGNIFVAASWIQSQEKQLLHQRNLKVTSIVYVLIMNLGIMKIFISILMVINQSHVRLIILQGFGMLDQEIVFTFQTNIKIMFFNHNLILLEIIVQQVRMICIFYNDISTCKIWDVKTGKCIKTLKGHQGGIINLSFNINGTRIVTTSEDSAGRIFNVKTGECVSQLLDSCNFGNKLQYLLPRNLIITECSDSSPRIYSETGELLQVLQIGGRTEFSYSPNFDGVIVVVSQGDNPKLEVWKDIQN